jgi:hypothetical protein
MVILLPAPRLVKLSSDMQALLTFVWLTAHRVGPNKPRTEVVGGRSDPRVRDGRRARVSP